MSFVKEFKEFALKGSMIDLAIGVVIGTAFNKLVSSIVTDLFMPIVGALMGFGDFSSLTLKINSPLKPNDIVEIKYGLFINSLIDFFIISLAVFIVIKTLTSLKKQNSNNTQKQTCPECLLEIPVKAKKCAFCLSELERK
jgi:large conductance mechanosensitive channel